MADAKLRALYDTFLDLHTQARKMEEHGAAYHVLAAALHAAESLGEPQCCIEVERRAREHGEWIDLHAPAHALSSGSAATRGHESIFKQLAVMASSARLRLQIQPQKQQGRRDAPLAKPKRRRN